MPHGHRVPVDQPRLRLRGPHRGHTRLGKPQRDSQLAPRPVEEFGVAPHLDDQVTRGEHRVLAEGQELGVPRRAGQ